MSQPVTLNDKILQAIDGVVERHAGGKYYEGCMSATENLIEAHGEFLKSHMDGVVRLAREGVPPVGVPLSEFRKTAEYLVRYNDRFLEAWHLYVELNEASPVRLYGDELRALLVRAASMMQLAVIARNGFPQYQSAVEKATAQWDLNVTRGSIDDLAGGLFTKAEMECVRQGPAHAVALVDRGVLTPEGHRIGMEGEYVKFSCPPGSNAYQGYRTMPRAEFESLVQGVLSKTGFYGGIGISLDYVQSYARGAGRESHPFLVEFVFPQPLLEYFAGIGVGPKWEGEGTWGVGGNGTPVPAVLTKTLMRNGDNVSDKWGNPLFNEDLAAGTVTWRLLEWIVRVK